MKSGRSSLQRWTCPGKPYGLDTRTWTRKDSGNCWTGSYTTLGTEARKVFITGRAGSRAILMGMRIALISGCTKISFRWMTLDVLRPLTGRGGFTACVKFATFDKLKVKLSLFFLGLFVLFWTGLLLYMPYIYSLFFLELVNFKCSWKMPWFERLQLCTIFLSKTSFLYVIMYLHFRIFYFEAFSF